MYTSAPEPTQRDLPLPHSTRCYDFVCVLSACLIAIIMTHKGMGSEATIAMNGDMPRYLMNGVYFYDLLHNVPVFHFLEYTYRYYCTYPSLSLGLHPVLISLATVPFYYAFGISVFSARLAVMFFFILAVVGLFYLTRSIYNRLVATLAAWLFSTTPFLIYHATIVMSEISTLSLIIVALYCLHSYCDTRTRRALVLFAVVVLLTVLAKHTAIFMFPVYLVYFVYRCGLASLFKKDTLIAGLILGFFLLPLIPLTLAFSQYNISLVSYANFKDILSVPNLLYHIKILWKYQLTLPVFVISIASIVLSMYYREKRCLLFLFWIVLLYPQITYIHMHLPRFSMFWIPPFCVLAAAIVYALPYKPWRYVCVASLVAAIIYQGALAWQEQPERTEGYEAAARYVVEHKKGQSVLFSGRIDSGYFSFFVRKHNPSSDLLVLLSDKVLVTNRMLRITEIKVQTPEHLYDILKQYGVAYIVIEDKALPIAPLEMLRHELQTSANFLVHQRIPMRSTHRRLKNIDLVIYEYLGYTAASPDTILDLQVPLIGSSITMKLGDLLPPQRFQ